MGDRSSTHAFSVGPLPKRNPKIAARVIAGEAMVLTPHDSLLHTLNPVATRIWELLDSCRTMDALVDAVVQEFEVDRETATRDVEELLGDMVAKGLLVQ